MKVLRALAQAIEATMLEARATWICRQIDRHPERSENLWLRMERVNVATAKLHDRVFQ